MKNLSLTGYRECSEKFENVFVFILPQKNKALYFVIDVVKNDLE